MRFLYPLSNALSWDIFGYYLYLPANFIYHDLGLTNQDWLNKLIAHYQTTGTLYLSKIGPSGQWAIKYSLEMDVIFIHFFFVSYWLADSLDHQDTWPAIVFTFEHKGGSYKYFAGDLVCNDDENGNWKKISFDYITPEVRRKEDLLKVYVWHRGKKPVLIKA